MVKKISRIIQKQAEAVIPTPWGNFNMIAFSEEASDWMPHLALVHEDFDRTKPVLVRIHSECITGDLFGSKRCDCGEQLDKALELTAAKGGMVLYLRQEGRGIGLINKLKAYKLQDNGLNTMDANVHLGLEVDARQYDVAIKMLEHLRVKKICLLTNNPEKIEAFESSDITIVERVPLIIEPNEDNLNYLKTKADDMGHMFDL
jgi:3,4-dihydroxy 2-butanone 4-phosphate synthase/GTP cyclohydrolase II